MEVESSAGSASGALLKRYGAQLGNANVVQVDYGQAASLVYFRRLLGKGRYPSADDPKWFLLLRYVDENDVRFSRFLKDMQNPSVGWIIRMSAFAYLSELVFALPR